MFGSLEIKPMTLRVFRENIELFEGEGGIIYRRGNVSVLIPGEGQLKVLPAPGKGYGVRFLMVRLRPTLAVPPSSTVKGYLNAPIDVRVTLGETEIDRFTPCREKYALYGEDNVGVIARYAVSQFYLKKPSSFCSLLPVLIKNESSSWFHIKRLVFPIGNCAMFYRRDEAYYPQMIVSLKTTPLVVNTGNPPDGTLEVASSSRGVLTFRMRWL